MCWWYRPWYPMFMFRRRRRHHWRRRYWRRRFFWGAPGCGCLPLVLLAALVLFMFTLSMCSGACWYW
jgi:hypothetical protein